MILPPFIHQLGLLLLLQDQISGTKAVSLTCFSLCQICWNYRGNSPTHTSPTVQNQASKPQPSVAIFRPVLEQNTD